ncbi:MAG: PLDc_N domain-containing protein [Actinobacteria bacterium]|nr:MAG: PLDc_N domain-containing protein [Actinomycetota bacterium]
MALAQDEFEDAGGAAAAGFGVLTLVCGFFFFVIWLAALAFWIWMIVDVVKREEAQFPNSTGNSKTIWLLVVILLGVIGAIVYYFAVKRKAPLPK